jgi:hypothetical protein
MLAGGSRLANIAESLVLSRSGRGMYARRGGLRHLPAEWELQRRLQEYGLIGPLRRATNLVVRLGFRLLPAPLLRVVYGRVFRRLADAPASR